MRKYISVSKDAIGRLMKAFNVTDRCVKNALAYRSDSELAQKIRCAAVRAYYGVTYYISTEFECFYDSDSNMHQVFPNGAEIYLDKTAGDGVVYDTKGNVVAKYADMHVREIYWIQQMAAAL